MNQQKDCSLYKHVPNITSYTPNVINDDVFKDPNYISFINNNPNIFINIKDILKKDFYGYTVEYISEQLDVSAVHVNQIISAWNNNYCTYFAKYGRVIYNPSNQRWIYVPKQHPQSRVSNLSFDNLQFHRI